MIVVFELYYHLSKKMDSLEIEDILKTAHDHLTLLKSVENQLQKAVIQILETKEETEMLIKKTFSKLKNDFVNILNGREKHLLDEIDKVKITKLLYLLIQTTFR